MAVAEIEAEEIGILRCGQIGPVRGRSATPLLAFVLLR
jgi:hypothetical protein